MMGAVMFNITLWINLNLIIFNVSLNIHFLFIVFQPFKNVNPFVVHADSAKIISLEAIIYWHLI